MPQCVDMFHEENGKPELFTVVYTLAEAYEEYGGSYEKVAETYNISRATVARYLALRFFTEDEQGFVMDHGWTLLLGTAMNSVYKDKRLLDKLMKDVERYKLNGKEAIARARELNAGKLPTMQTWTLLKKYKNGKIDIRRYVGDIDRGQARRLLARLEKIDENILEIAAVLIEALKPPNRP